MTPPKGVQLPPWVAAGIQDPRSRALVDEVTGRPRAAGVGAVCVVTAKDVERCSQSGWVLAMVVHSSRVDRPHGGDLGACACRACNEATQVVEVPLFVMVRGVASELDKAREQAANWQREAERLIDEHRQLVDARVAVLRERDDMRDERDAAVTRLAQAVKAAESRVAQLGRIEADLAKVRREVGEKEWKRITGEA